VDTVGEAAKVSRVVDTLTTSDPTVGGRSAYRLRWGLAPVELQRSELLCITPCSIDLRLGAHTLLFASLADPTRSGSADINVTTPLSAVRHSLGRSKPLSVASLTGILLAVGGGALTLVGATLTTVGATAPDTSARAGGTNLDRPAVVGAGLVTLGVGLALGVLGVVIATQNRPTEQAGSTIQWDVGR
jgi:hypothetical protein